MAKRFIDTEIWDKEWFMALSQKHKLLIQFIFSKCDVAGIWAPNWALASTYIGSKVSLDDLKTISNQVILLEDGKVFVHGFIEFQYGVLSETCNPHKKIIAILQKYNLYERVLQGYFKGSPTLQDKDKDKEEEKDKDKGGVGENESKPIAQPINLPFSTELFASAWQRFKEFKKKRFKFSYHDVKSEQLALNELFKLSDGIEAKSVAIIDQSIMNGWKGLFELKNANTVPSSQNYDPNNPDHINPYNGLTNRENWKISGKP